MERFDVPGRQLLKTNQKLYIVDLGIHRHLLPRKRYDLGFSLENVVYLELLRRGCKVNSGKVGTAEIDFVARKNDCVDYFQVTASMLEESTFNREMAPLKAITDNYPKTVITLDRYTPGNYEGIQIVNAIDWLLKQSLWKWLFFVFSCAVFTKTVSLLRVSRKKGLAISAFLS